MTRSLIKVMHEDALTALKDPPLLIQLNPLVARHEVKPDDPSTYVITDNIKFLCFTTTTTYHAKAEFNENGITFHVKAPGCMRSTNHWIANRRTTDDTDVVEVVEESHIEAPFLFIPFIVGNIKRSHNELMERLKAKLEGTSK